MQVRNINKYNKGTDVAFSHCDVIRNAKIAKSIEANIDALNFIKRDRTNIVKPILGASLFPGMTSDSKFLSLDIFTAE